MKPIKTPLVDNLREVFWQKYYYTRMRVVRRLSRSKRTKEFAKVPAILINYNRLSWPKAMCEQLAQWEGVEPIILDNNSSYPPLLEWYRNCPYKVIRLKHNLGHLAPWKSGIAFQLGRYYIATDPDLDLTGIPTDTLAVLRAELEAHTYLRKVGLGLEIRDLPDTSLSSEVQRCEQAYWEHRVNDSFFEAMIDTTLALYDSERENFEFMRSHRSDHPYVARHLPWYQTETSLSEEDRYYLSTLKTSTHWSSQMTIEKPVP